MRRDIVILLDASSSMKAKTSESSPFQKAVEAIQKICAKNKSGYPDDFLTIIFFWDEILKGFRAETLYQSVPLSTVISPEKLLEFGEPASLAGTRLEEGLDFAIKFLDNKQGEKVIKLVTDNAVNTQQLREKNRFRLLEKEIRLDCIIIADRENIQPPKVVGVGRMGQTFEESNVDKVVEDLLL